MMFNSFIEINLVSALDFQRNMVLLVPTIRLVAMTSMTFGHETQESIPFIQFYV